MAMNELNKRLQVILKNDFYPFLRQYGFITKKNMGYRISGDSVAQWIKVEKSRWNTGDMLHFDLHLYTVYGNYTLDAEVNSETDLIKNVRVPISYKLWELDNSHGIEFGFYHTTDDVFFANELRERFTSVALPFFEQTKTLDDMIGFLLDEEKRLADKGNFCTIGMLYCIKKDFVNGRKYMMEAPGDRDAKIRVAREYGLDLTQPQ